MKKRLFAICLSFMLIVSAMPASVFDSQAGQEQNTDTTQKINSDFGSGGNGSSEDTLKNRVKDRTDLSANSKKSSKTVIDQTKQVSDNKNIDKTPVNYDLSEKGRITSVNMYTYNDEKDSWDLYDNKTPFPNDTSVKLDISYKALKDEYVYSGDSFSYKLPSVCKLASEQTFEVKEGTTVVGSAKIDKSGNVTITLNDKFSDENGRLNYKGTFSCWAKLSLEQKEKEYTVTIPFTEEYKYDVVVKPKPVITNKSVTIAKSIPSYKYENGNADGAITHMKYRLLVIANAKNTEDLTGLVISDNFTLGAKYINYLNNGTYPVTAMINGQSVNLSEWLDVDMSSSPVKFKLKTGKKLTAGQKLTIDYWVKVDPRVYSTGSNSVEQNIRNHASVTDNNGVNASTDYSKIITKNWIKKTGRMDITDGKITYSVSVNETPVQNITGWTLKDILGKGQIYDGKITVSKYSKGPVGANSATLIETKTFDPQSKTSFEYVADGAYYYLFTYDVKVDSSVANMEKLSNKFEMTPPGGSGGGSGSVSGTSTGAEVTYSYYNLDKIAGTLNLNDQTISWTTTLNAIKNDSRSIGEIPKGAVYYDVPHLALTSGSLTSADMKTTSHKVLIDSIVLTDGDGNVLRENQDYKVTAFANGEYYVVQGEVRFNEGYKIDFLKDIKSAVTIKYNTKADINSSIKKEFRYSNKAELKIGDQTYQSNAYVQYNNNSLLNKTAADSVDLENKKVFWNITFNQNSLKMDYDDVYILEHLPDGLRFDSVTSDKKNVDIKTEEVKGTNDVKLILSGNLSQKVTLKLWTKITDDTAFSTVNGKSFINKADLFINNKKLRETQASKTIKVNLLTKTGLYSDATAPNVQYTLKLNEAGAVLGNGKTLTLKDDMTSNMSIVPGSMKVYEMINNVRHELSSDKWTLSQNSDGHGFNLTIPDGMKLEIYYEAYVQGHIGSSQNIKNTASLLGEKEEIVKVEDSKKVVVKEGSATATGDPILYIYKVDAANSTPLSGAKFDIYSVNDLDDPSDDVKLNEKPLVSGDKGQIILSSLKFDTYYYLVETEAPKGYSLDVTKHNFIILGRTSTIDTNKILDDFWKLQSGTPLNLTNDSIIDIDVNKVWDDNDNSALLRPKTVEVNLYANGIDTEKNVTLNKDNNWQGSFIGFKEYKNGKKIDYTVKETPIDYYVPTVEGNSEKGFTITNTFENSSYYYEGEINITKKVLFYEEPFKVYDVFYAGVFADEACTDLVQDVDGNDLILPIVLNGESEGSVTAFVPLGEEGSDVTYYVREVDANGKVINNDSGFDYNVNVSPSSVTVNKDTKGNVTITNSFGDIGYYYDGQLTINKKVLGANGKAKKVQDVFYAGVYTDKGCKKPLKDEDGNDLIVPLVLADESSTSTTVTAPLGEKGKSVTYYVKEVDENGKDVKNSKTFEYKVSIDKTSVSVSAQGGSTTITNKVDSSKVTIKDNKTPTSSGVDTSDNTNSVLFTVIFILSLAGILLIIKKMKIKQ